MTAKVKIIKATSPEDLAKQIHDALSEDNEAMAADFAKMVKEVNSGTQCDCASCLIERSGMERAAEKQDPVAMVEACFNVAKELCNSEDEVGVGARKEMIAALKLEPAADERIKALEAELATAKEAATMWKERAEKRNLNFQNELPADMVKRLDVLHQSKYQSEIVSRVRDWLGRVAPTPAPSPAFNTEMAVRRLVDVTHSAAYSAGWWNTKDGSDPTKNPLMFSNKLALIHSEISEALEGDRKGLVDPHLPQFDNRTVELADALIRIGDLAGAYSLPLAEAVVAKMAFNKERADHKPDARAAAGGKAY